MSPETVDAVALQRIQMRESLTEFRPQLDAGLAGTVDRVTVVVLGSLLHSFYGGVENILKLLMKGSGGRLPTGPNWHADLLDAFTCALDSWPALLDEDLHRTLKAYLLFRHVFRTHYLAELRWASMEPLVRNLESTVDRFEAALDRWLASQEP